MYYFAIIFSFMVFILFIFFNIKKKKITIAKFTDENKSNKLYEYFMDYIKINPVFSESCQICIKDGKIVMSPQDNIENYLIYKNRKIYFMFEKKALVQVITCWVYFFDVFNFSKNFNENIFNDFFEYLVEQNKNPDTNVDNKFMIGTKISLAKKKFSQPRLHSGFVTSLSLEDMSSPLYDELCNPSGLEINDPHKSPHSDNYVPKI